MGTFTVSQLFERELRRLIDVEIERLKENMSFGMVEDFDEYRFISGKIAGLRLAIEYMDAVSYTHLTLPTNREV